MTIPSLDSVFVAIAVIFLTFAVRDLLKAEGKLTPARKTWLRVALIFACVAIALFVVRSVNLFGQ